MTTAQDGGRLSALRIGRLYPPRNVPGTHFCYRMSRPQGHSAIGRIICQWKILMTPAGIVPATFRCVAQHLNHCAAACPSQPWLGCRYFTYFCTNRSCSSMYVPVNKHLTNFPKTVSAVNLVFVRGRVKRRFLISLLQMSPEATWHNFASSRWPASSGFSLS